MKYPVTLPRRSTIRPCSFRLGLLLLCLLPGLLPAAPNLRGSLGIHDPSTMIQCNGRYYVFATGQGIASKSSADREFWVTGPNVFASPPAWTTAAVPGFTGHFWAPDVVYTNGLYHLYYSCSTFGSQVSGIGLVTSPTLDPADPNYLWTDRGAVILSTNTNNFNAIDPAVARDADGRLWLAFGSFWSGIKLIPLDPDTGRRLAGNSTLYSLAFNDSIEAPFIHRHDGYYYLFVNWGRCCVGTNSTYEIRVGRSKKITGPYLDRDGADLMNHGGTPFLSTAGPFIGPGHAGIVAEGGGDWLSCHFYDGTRHGMSTLALLPLRWHTNGWPEADRSLAR